MPLYDYKCKSCDYQFEEINKVDVREEQKCLKCGSSTEILISISRESLKFFPEGFWRDLSHEPIYISSRQQLKDECRKHGCYAKYLDGYSGH